MAHKTTPLANDDKSIQLAMKAAPKVISLSEGLFLRRQIKGYGVEPQVVRAEKKAEARRKDEELARAPRSMFKAVALEWLKKTSAAKNWQYKHAADVERSLRQKVIPYLGERPIDSIQPVDILGVLKRM